MTPSHPIVPPIHRGAVFEFDTTAALAAAVGDHTRDFSYGRYDNPTVAELEREIAALEGAERALAFASGMAAIATTVFGLLPPGGRVVHQADLYGGTVELFHELVPRLAGKIMEVPAADPDALEREIRAGADLIYLESPVNPTLDIVDLRRMARAARDVGGVTLVDNTFATPLGQRPIDLGLDVSLHSATKFLGGHHDVVAGVAALSAELAEKVWSARKLLGPILSPADAFLLLRGLRTLRIRWEAASRTAGSLARRLTRDPRVRRVRYPGLPGDPGHALAASQMQGFGAMIAFEPATDAAGAEGFLDGLRVIRRAASLGGTESLAMLPARVSHAVLTPAERRKMGVTDALVRLSVGTEPEEELVEDLERGFRAMED